MQNKKRVWKTTEQIKMGKQREWKRERWQLLNTFGRGGCGKRRCGHGEEVLSIFIPSFIFLFFISYDVHNSCFLSSLLLYIFLGCEFLFWEVLGCEFCSLKNVFLINENDEDSLMCDGEYMVEWVEWYMESNNVLFATFRLSPLWYFFVLNL